MVNLKNLFLQLVVEQHGLTRDEVTAATAEHFFHVMHAARGNTAEPMMMPMTRYTHPRLRPISSRMMAMTPEMTAHKRAGGTGWE